MLRDYPNASAQDSDEQRGGEYSGPNSRVAGPNQLVDLFSVVIRRWIIVLAVGGSLAAAIFAVALFSPRVYTANAVVMINASRDQIVGQGKGIDSETPNASAIDSEMEIFRSRTLLRRLVETLKLEEDSEFNPRPLDQANATASEVEAARDNATDAVANTVSVRRRGSSNGIEVSVETKDAKKSALMANRLIDLYLQFQVETRFSSVDRANTWLVERLDGLRQQVRQKEAAAEAFRLESGLSVGAGGGDSPAVSSDVETLLVGARADLAEREARLRQVERMVKEGRSADTIADVLNSQVISDLRARDVELTAKEAELAQRYADIHPSLQSTRSEIVIVRQRIADEVARVSANLRNEVEVAKARLGELQGSFGRVAGANGQDNASVIRYRELLRDAAATRGVYENFLSRSNEIAQQANLPTTTSRLISAAKPPSAPSKPNLRAALLMALLLGAIGGLAAGFVVEMLFRTLSSAEDVERQTGLPAVASIPILKADVYQNLPDNSKTPPQYLVAKPTSRFAESLRVLRTAIIHARIDEKVRVVALTSALPDEGKTTISLCLARVCATAGQKVALIDCDLRRPSLTQGLQVEVERGLVEVLSGQCDWRSAMIKDACAGLEIMPVTAAGFTPQDLFYSKAMRGLMTELRGAYDIVILDCAPVLAIAETRTIVTLADAALLVVRSERTSVDAVQSTIRQIHDTGVDLLGVVLNCVDRRPGRPAYGDMLHYNRANTDYYDA